MNREDAATPSATAPVDACWNRIGTRGDGSCEQLSTYSRCLNCPVFEHAASKLLDRPLDDADLAAAAQAARATNADRAVRASSRKAAGAPGASSAAAAPHSALVFRVADEWLALPSTALKQIDDIRPIHSLPHRRNRIVLGLVNIRGALTVAVSLAELLHLDRTASVANAPRKIYPRMLVAAHRSEPVAFPVDEVEGVVRFAASELLPVPTTLAHTTHSHASGVLAWRDTTIGLLDPDRVFESLAGSLR
ncbi:purine-binding chemotaxis protein CheW [Trinickia violacea]|uniref:Chemotaxis protein CheW n=1 Tax=Trinickia violacea TaxID=2571746 RepID=A0A4P8J401_9BURK|nr:chemotaxis protein CheW [Trinickia violacea]QCP54684.1 purine-binding chemotaxis protein CheW [Trinickia violacea]